ncbi:major facilitator superfamily MFS_1 [Fibrella aestuarina BUZ 2]|uniref:Major facilitator superfamily MFS_1 n=2 Tax=Fibrella TaxID=861914 RepID=I0K564_9BACT|nr:major facilitator superfamily MFS_1 [Fibrella aestuarina BUZ 2]
MAAYNCNWTLGNSNRPKDKGLANSGNPVSVSLFLSQTPNLGLTYSVRYLTFFKQPMQTEQVPSPTVAPDKPSLTFWQIWNMSFGFLGIQYGFGLQQANMSPIYRYLGADEASIPGLWLAGPLTGLLLQPIIGAVSDRSWSPTWGRRKPFILVGALLGSIAMILMPNSSVVWMAAGLMWMLDAGLNSAMEPFRAFVGDMLNKEQRPTGFAVQSFMVGFGQTLANLMPYILPMLGISMVMSEGQLANGIPNSVRYPFYIGGAAIVLSVLWTMRTTKEYPPHDESYKNAHVFTEEEKKSISFWHLAMAIGAAVLAFCFAAGSGGWINGLKWGMGVLAGGYLVLMLPVFKEILASLSSMPTAMRQLWWVKFFTWYGLPLMWQYLSLSVAKYAFNAPDTTSNPAGFEEGTKWGGLCFAMFSISCAVISIFIPRIAKAIGSARATHALFLCIGAVGFFLTLTSNDRMIYLVAMSIMGLAWGSIMSMPYLILAGAVPPAKMGVYMGIFNGFICVPQFIGMLTVPLYYKTLLGNDPRNALILCGICLVLAAASCFLVKENSSTVASAGAVGGGGGH